MWPLWSGPVPAILADLTDLDELRTEHEQNEQALVGHRDPITDEEFFLNGFTQNTAAWSV